ncbi:hypothetical protein [Priestia megaterium]|uniref:Uncharacterized protein n=1 Tax=Priestia megaterium TaxID=1404 RepID=A0A6M6DQ65_PRIMG|nr:hypothetical protein [Priestia megaterium]QJX74739.1 hypothetical protein FDZ14_00540 [Priestia megaterium]
MQDELVELLNEKVIPSLNSYAQAIISYEMSFENIVEMIIQQQREEADLDSLTDEEIKEDLAEILDELKEHIRRNKIICFRLCDAMKISIDKIDGLKIKNKKSVATVTYFNNTLTEGLISEVVAELEILLDKAREDNNQGEEKVINNLVKDLEEMVERTFEVSSLLMIALGLNFDNMEIDPEQEESFFKKPTEREIKGKSRFDDDNDKGR